MQYSEMKIGDWIPKFIRAGFERCFEQPSFKKSGQERGNEYKFIHPKLMNFLEVKTSEKRPGYFYLKNFSNDGEAYLGFGLNAQKIAGEKLEVKSGIVHNAEDSYDSGQYCWKDEKLDELLSWISRI